MGSIIFQTRIFRRAICILGPGHPSKFKKKNKNTANILPQNIILVNTNNQ